MKNLNDSIKELFEIAFKNAGFENVDVAILPCNLANMGDFQCNNALSIAKVYGKSPRDIALKVLENIPDNATTPKSSGINIRANTTDTPKEISCIIVRCIICQNKPDRALLFKSLLLEDI